MVVVKAFINNNYFDYFGLEVNFDIDTDELDDKYLELQSRNHPDSFSNNDVRKKKDVRNNSILINEAYQVLRSPLKRAEYLLSLFLKKSYVIKPTEDLLMEVMEMREQAKEDDPFLSMNYSSCVEKIKEAFVNNDLMDMAHQTMRLKYITKIKEDICN
ncbi:MAG: Fe-S protein assembly co-chaperone HscB [Rickettsiaceae bacterium H1]|nr:Fe-S protein assembly co-chaperone HscB [Rickettsiaceae bacterium H1]